MCQRVCVHVLVKGCLSCDFRNSVFSSSLNAGFLVHASHAFNFSHSLLGNGFESIPQILCIYVSESMQRMKMDNDEIISYFGRFHVSLLHPLGLPWAFAVYSLTCTPHKYTFLHSAQSVDGYFSLCFVCFFSHFLVAFLFFSLCVTYING